VLAAEAASLGEPGSSERRSTSRSLGVRLTPDEAWRVRSFSRGHPVYRVQLRAHALWLLAEGKTPEQAADALYSASLRGERGVSHLEADEIRSLAESFQHGRLAEALFPHPRQVARRARVMLPRPSYSVTQAERAWLLSLGGSSSSRRERAEIVLGLLDGATPEELAVRFHRLDSAERRVDQLADRLADGGVRFAVDGGRFFTRDRRDQVKAQLGAATDPERARRLRAALHLDAWQPSGALSEPAETEPVASVLAEVERELLAGDFARLRPGPTGSGLQAQPHAMRQNSGAATRRPAAPRVP
jgi:hypothetical protein